MTNTAWFYWKYLHSRVFPHIIVNIKLLSINWQIIGFGVNTSIVMKVGCVYFFETIIFPESRMVLQNPSKKRAILSIKICHN